MESFSLFHEVTGWCFLKSLDDDITDMANPRQASNFKPLASLVPATTVIPKAGINVLVGQERDGPTIAQSPSAATDAVEVEAKSKGEDSLASDLGKLTLTVEARDLDVLDDEREDREDDSWAFTDAYGNDSDGIDSIKDFTACSADDCGNCGHCDY